MANQPFDPQNPVYPPRCYAVPTTNKTIFQEPNKTGKPEIDFNKYMYLAPNPDNGELEMVSNQCIRDIIRSPESPWEAKLQGMVMIGPSGKPVPAHIPNLLDIVGTVNLVDVFKRLNKGDEPYNTKEISEVVPKFLEKVIYPCPNVVVEGPVYPLTCREVETELGCYTDGFQVFYMHANISEILIKVDCGRFRVDLFIRFMAVTLTCQFEEGSDAFHLGSSIVLWNARGVTRPSFKSNLLKIVSVHKPIIFVITEVRVGRKSFKEAVKAFVYDVDWSLDDSVGNCGGVCRVLGTIMRNFTNHIRSHLNRIYKHNT